MEDCIICSDNFLEQAHGRPMIAPCGHMFHGRCWEGWFKEFNIPNHPANAVIRTLISWVGNPFYNPKDNHYATCPVCRKWVQSKDLIEMEGPGSRLDEEVYEYIDHPNVKPMKDLPRFVEVLQFIAFLVIAFFVFLVGCCCPCLIPQSMLQTSEIPQEDGEPDWGQLLAQIRAGGQEQERDI